MHRGTQSLGSEPKKYRSEAQLGAEIDRQLTKSFLGGDESAFEEIVHRHKERIFSVTLALLKNRADAEEMTQDTFIRAYRGLAKFRGDSSLATWLHRIAVNLARNRYWYFHRRRKYDTLSLDRPLGEEGDTTFANMLENPTPTPELETIISEFERILKRSMKLLTFKKRELLELWIDEHMTYEQIAEAYGINVGTVKSRLARARENLIGIICQNYPELVYRDQFKEIFKVASRHSALRQTY
jgi:RNA polymerase sigma-70 factor, ECF subfamily